MKNRIVFLFILSISVSLISCNSADQPNSSLNDSLQKDSNMKAIQLNDSALLLVSRDSSNLDSALLLTQKALQLDSGNIIVQTNRLSWLVKDKKYAEALREIEILDNLEPANSETIFLHGLLAEKLNKKELAQAKYKQAFLLNDKEFKGKDSDDKLFQTLRQKWAMTLYFLNEIEGKKEFKKMNSEYPDNKTAADFLSKERAELFNDAIDNR
ncbi:tetratricopeptide repeat protein [Daejeonella oryzae]|uniref:tetratricopeptide repeat protein n=1 Tax=Daejeonella oryzae TaxID=1122943 RepID=UPI00047974D4|nr:hypothetical protein [Daejeonella oryzae]